MGYIFTFLISIFLVSPCFAEGGYIGGGQSINSSVTFDKQGNGFRIDWGTKATSGIDLEWNYVDFGTSSYDDPTPKYDIVAEAHENTVIADFDNTRFGTVSRTNGSYVGISSIHTQGLSAGLKFKLQSNNWLQLFARASFLAWQANTTDVSIYANRAARDAEGNLIAEGDTTSEIKNYNPCNQLGACTRLSTGKTFYAVNFWYGYGVIIKPYSWMALRMEYSNTTLSAKEFPEAKLDQFNTSLELHF